MNEKVLKIIDEYWGDILVLLDDVMKEKLIDWDIAGIVWDKMHEIRDIIDKKKEDFWFLEIIDDSMVAGHLEKDGIIGRLLVNAIPEGLLLTVTGEWKGFIWKVELEAGKDFIPELNFSVIWKPKEE
jgi:hypothetical protein